MPIPHRHALPHAPALERVLKEAEDIARATGQEVTTAHLLLGFFTTRNQAERLLRDRSIDEDRILDLIDPLRREPRDAVREVLERAAQITAGCGAREVDCLHVLVAMTRARDALAHALLEGTGEKISLLRTRALTILTGAVPRWLGGSSYGRPPAEHADVRVSSAPSRTRSALPVARGAHSDRDGRASANFWTPPMVPSAPFGRKMALPERRRPKDEEPRRAEPEAAPAETAQQPPSPKPPLDKPPKLPSLKLPDPFRPGPGPGERGRGPTDAARKPGARGEPNRSPGGAPGAGARAGSNRAANEPEARSGPKRAPGEPEARSEPNQAPGAEAQSESNRAPGKPAARGEPHRAAPASPGPASPGPAAPGPAPADPGPEELWQLAPDSYPWLTSLGRNLTVEAARGELDRLVGRAKEVEALIDILGKRRANNPCLVGEPGVGKTAVVEGLAARLVREPRGTALAKKIIISLDVGALLVGTHLRGSFSEKLQGLAEEVKRSKGRVVVFFDELHTLVGAGSTGDGPQDAANELKTALARGEFPCIGATTSDEYAKHIAADPALERRFVPVLIKEPTQDEAADMLRQIMPAYAEHHGVGYEDEAITAAVSLSVRYVTDRHLPDKAIALLDLAGSRAARSRLEMVTRELVAQLVAERADLPVERLLHSDRSRLLELEQHLKREIVGHERVLTRIAEVIRRNAAGFTTHRPAGVFLFFGPTGVGKTETAKALARLLHGAEDSLIRFDLSEFSEAHAVARLIGAPPGYVGHDAGGQLTEAVRRRPGRVILFDEIEKAHREVLQLLLQILDEGRLTDGRGRTVSFAETIVILTSNLGADVASGRRRIGFSGGDLEEREELEEAMLERARERLSPELWGRIEERLVFAPLQREEVRQIARLLAADSSQRLTRERGITYELDERAVDFLLEQGGFDLGLGARPMRQILARIVEAPIAARILEGRLHADEHVWVSTRENGGLIFLVGDDRTSLSQRPPA